VDYEPFVKPLPCSMPVNMEGEMKSLIVKRSIGIAGHKTSVSLEDAFWKGLKEICDES
jgi:predicted DNA-binding ribbon-helix-helix protein